jgi:DNA (cytosine-5)-methyltransferase 1
VNLGTASGKTAHIIDRKLGAHKGAGRVWFEGRRLVDIGFRPGLRYQVVATPGESLVLRLSAQGDHRVSHKPDGRPVVDVLTRALGDVDRMQVRFEPGEVLVTLHPLDRAAGRRMARLNQRLARGEALRLGSVCHGGGVASDALLRGLRRSGAASRLEVAIEMNERYMGQSLAHNPAWSDGGMSIEQDLRDVDPRDVPEVDLLEAGLPCVAASIAGRAKKGLERPEDDPQVQDMAEAFLDIVRAADPAVILLENVPEYADSDSAATIRRRLVRWGYTLHEQVLDGAEWSLEARRRWVLIATSGRAFDVSALVPAERPSALGDVLDRKVPASAWRKLDGLATKAAKDAALGRGFSRGRKLLTPADTTVPTLRRGYQRGGSCDVRLAHPTRAGVGRLFSAAEHARIKGIPEGLVTGLSEKVAHEVLGQSVISPEFSALGAAIAASVL